MRTKNILLGAGAVGLLAPVVPPVLAQSVLEEVVVTAQRREQSLQDVPVSVTAFSGEQIANLGITEAAQYLQLSPNVSYTEDGQVGSRGISISMRGVSNINTDESAFIQSIGIYLDEFSVAATANATINPQLQDLERVEVLRGPQGTYFGRNSVGGALNLTTRKPVDKFEGEVRITGQTYETTGSQWGVTGILNVPITDTLFIRGVGYYEDNSGIVENIVPGGGDSGHEYISGRLAARWLATDRTTFDLMVMHTDEEQGLDETVPAGVWDTDTVGTFFLNNPAGTTFSQPLNDGTGFWPDNRDKVAHTAIGEENNNETTLIVFNAAHSLTDEVKLKFVAGYIDTKNQKVFDNDLVPEDVVNRFQEKNGESWSTELRLEMTKERFDWVLGFLYAQDEITKDPYKGRFGVVTGVTTAVDGGVSLAPVPGGGDPTVPIVGPGIVDFALVGALPPLFNLAPPPATFFLTDLTPDGQPPLCLSCNFSSKELESWAVFQDFTWHATDRLDLIFGFRYTEDKVDQEFVELGLFRTPRIPDPSDPTGLTPIPTVGKETFTDFSPRFSGTFEVTSDFRVYATVSKGYKAGGFTQDFESNTGTEVNEKFDEETLWSYEAGIKSEWFDDRLRVNAAVFYNEWSDLQLETFFFAVPGDATSNVQRTINVRDAEAIGFELELAAAPTERLTVSGGVGWLDTQITSDDVAQLSGNQFVNLKNHDLPRSPEWTLSAVADYRWPWQGHQLYLRGEWAYRSGQFSTVEDVTFRQTSNQPVLADPTDPTSAVLAVIPDRSSGFPFKSPDYHLLNLRAGIVWNERVELNVFVVNLLDEEYYTGTGENFGLSGFRLRPHPRYFGGGISYRF